MSGFTRIPRHEAIARVKDAIGSCGGFILDTHMYSNAMLAINFEIPACEICPLVQALEEAGLALGHDNESVMHDLGVLDSAISGSLNVNFIHDEPQLRIEVPAVPG